MERSERFVIHGQFNVAIGQNITEAVRKNAVPNEFGIYIVHEGHNCTGQPIYIGRSGTILNNGERRSQGIAQRLGKKQAGKSRNTLFKEVMKSKNKGISVAWFVTLSSNGKGILPALAEAEAIQEFYDLHGKLPELNKSI
jgi:hypothetical protein